MEETSKMISISIDEIFTELKVIMKEVAPMKIIGEITMDKSIRADFAFDSINIMEMLLKIQEKFLNQKPIDVEKFMADISDDNNQQFFTIRQICELIQKEAQTLN